MQIQFNEKNAISYIEKILYLEKSLGENISFKIFNPIELKASYNDLTKTAKEIAQFVGVNSLLTVVRTNTMQHVSGQIEHDGKFDFIEISNDSNYSYENICAILAHEIMHRYLYSHGLKYNIPIENEILTDIATIYTGLGKLSLNGIFSKNQTKKAMGENIVTTTSTNMIGYIDMDSFCFVYLLINKLRRIPEKTFMEGLNSTAINALKSVRTDVIYQKLISYVDNYEQSVVTCINYYKQSEKDNMNINNRLTKINQFVSTLNKRKVSVDESQSQIYNIIHSMENNCEYNPIIRGLNSIKHFCDIDDRIKNQKDILNNLSARVNEIYSLVEPKSSYADDKRVVMNTGSVVKKVYKSISLWLNLYTKDKLAFFISLIFPIVLCISITFIAMILH